jgi:hypothetical protein
MARPTPLMGSSSRNRRNLRRAKERFGKDFYTFDDWEGLGPDERNALMDALTYMVNSGGFYDPKQPTLGPTRGTRTPFPGWGVI